MWMFGIGRVSWDGVLDADVGRLFSGGLENSRTEVVCAEPFGSSAATSELGRDRVFWIDIDSLHAV
jgi:hypothetical protein